MYFLGFLSSKVSIYYDNGFRLPTPDVCKVYVYSHALTSGPRVWRHRDCNRNSRSQVTSRRRKVEKRFCGRENRNEEFFHKKLCFFLSCKCGLSTDFVCGFKSYLWYLEPKSRSFNYLTTNCLETHSVILVANI